MVESTALEMRLRLLFQAVSPCVHAVLICLENLVGWSSHCRFVSYAATELGSKMVARYSGFVLQVVGMHVAALRCSYARLKN